MCSYITEIVRVQYDPLSVSETRSLVETVRNILDYPFIAPKSKCFTKLMNTIIEKIDQAIEHDISKQYENFVLRLPYNLHSE